MYILFRNNDQAIYNLMPYVFHRPHRAITIRVCHSVVMLLDEVHIYNMVFCPLLMINNDTSSIPPMLQWHRSSHPGYRFSLSGQLLLGQWKHRTLNELHNAGTRSPPPQKETIFSGIYLLQSGAENWRNFFQHVALMQYTIFSLPT